MVCIQCAVQCDYRYPSYLRPCKLVDT